MSVPSLLYPLTDGTFAFGSQVFADLSQIVSALTANLDSGNVSVARGIGANYITSNGTGASGVFQAGSYAFNAGTASQTALNVNGIIGQTANIFSVNAPTTSNSVWVDKNGVLNTTVLPIFAGGSGGIALLSPPAQQAGFLNISGNISAASVNFSGNGNPTASSVYIAADGTGGMFYNIPASSPNGYRWFNANGAGTAMSLTAGGALSIASTFTAPNANIGGTLNVASISVSNINATNLSVAGGLSVGGSLNVTANASASAFVANAANGNPSFTFPNGAGGSGVTWIGAFNGNQIYSISGTAMLVSAIGVGDCFTVDNGGNMGVRGGLVANQLSANRGRIDVAGDVGSATGSASGRYWFGQGGSAQALDYNVTAGGVFAMSAGLIVGGNQQVNGQIHATNAVIADAGFYGSGANLSTNTIPLSALTITPTVTYDAAGTAHAGVSVFGVATSGGGGNVLVTLPFPFTSYVPTVCSASSGFIATAVVNNGQQFTVSVINPGVGGVVGATVYWHVMGF